VETKDFDLRSKLRRDQEFHRGGDGPNHFFNCNRDGHY
jgi:hypothetical protein